MDHQVTDFSPQGRRQFLDYVSLHNRSLLLEICLEIANDSAAHLLGQLMMIKPSVDRVHAIV